MADHEPEPAYDRWSRPDALSRRGYVLVALVPVLVAAAAFGVVSLVSAGDEPELPGASVRLPVSDREPGDDANAAEVGGVLRVDDDRCVYLETDSVPSGRLYAVWPAGFQAALDGDRLTVYDDGLPVARDGDTIATGGGYVEAGTLDGEPCLPESGEIAVVQSEVTVTPAES